MGLTSHAGDISLKSGLWRHSNLWYNPYLVAKFESYIPSLKLKQRLKNYTVTVARDAYEHVTYA